MVTDLASMLAMVPRMSMGAAGGAAAARAVVVRAAKVADMVSVRNFMMFPFGCPAHRGYEFARGCKRAAIYAVPCSSGGLARTRPEQDLDATVARIALVVAGGDAQMRLAIALGRDPAGLYALPCEGSRYSVGALVGYREIPVRGTRSVGIGADGDHGVDVAAQNRSQRLQDVVAVDAAIRAEQLVVGDHQIDVVALPGDHRAVDVVAQIRLHRIHVGLDLGHHERPLRAVGCGGVFRRRTRRTMRGRRWHVARRRLFAALAER